MDGILELWPQVVSEPLRDFMFPGPDPATVNPAVCIRYLMDVLPKPSE